MALAFQVYDRQAKRRDVAAERANDKPHRDWELAEDIVEASRATLTDLRAEVAEAKEYIASLKADLQVERAAFQTERKEMLDERARWANERTTLLAEIDSERSQRRSLETEVDTQRHEVASLTQRVGKLEAKLRELGHDPETIV
jgi:chromosome segregation ATPase